VCCFAYSGTLEDVRTEIKSHKSSYDVISSAVIEYPLEPTVFHCELRIPEAKYEVRKSLVYYPGEYSSPFFTRETILSCIKNLAINLEFLGDVLSYTSLINLSRTDS